MNLETHRYYVEAIRYGKKLPDAIYLFRPRKEDVCAELWETICRAEIAARPDPPWNLLKIHTDQVTIIFLTYPELNRSPSCFSRIDQDQPQYWLNRSDRFPATP